MIAVAITGISGAGKTSLIEKLIRKFSEVGIRVGYLKHSHHSFKFHPEGKDTSRIFEAGATQVLFAGKGVTVDLRREEVFLEEIMRRAAGVEVLLIEGFGREEIPSIEVVSEAWDGTTKGGGTIAIVGDVKEDRGVPVFPSHDIEGITDFILGLKSHEGK